MAYVSQVSLDQICYYFYKTEKGAISKNENTFSDTEQLTSKTNTPETLFVERVRLLFVTKQNFN